MSDMLIIPENLMALSQAGIGSGDEADATMAKTNLLNEDPSVFWRSITNLPNSTTLRFQLSNGAAMQASAFALIGHNLRRGDKYRIVLSSTAMPVGGFYEEIVPTGLVSSTNATGTYTAVDEGTTPDANWMTPTAAETPWVARFSFPAPATAPQVGVDRQCVAVYCKSDVTITTGATSPTVKAEIFETGGGAALADLGTKTIASDTGEWVLFSWNASVLATADGSAVEIQLTFSGRDVVLVPSSTPNGHLGSLVWIAEKPSFIVPISGGDMGWATYTPWVGTGITYYPEAVDLSSSLLVQFGGVKTFHNLYLQIRSDQAPSDFDPLTEVLNTPDGYVQAGAAIIGESWSPSRDIQHGPFIGSHDASSKGRTYGGQVFGSRRYVQRILSMPLAILTPEEAHTLFDRVIWRHGILKKFFVALMPGDATEGKHTGFLASLKNADHVMQTTPAEARNRSMTLDFEEEI